MAVGAGVDSDAGEVVDSAVIVEGQRVDSAEDPKMAGAGVDSDADVTRLTGGRYR